MTSADYVILMVTGLSLLIGFKQGFIRGFFPLLTLVAAIVIAVFSFNPLSMWLILWWLPIQSDVGIFGYSVSAASIVQFAFFAVTFLAVIILGSFLTSFLHRFVKTSAISVFDRVFGLLFGAVRAFLIVVVLMFFGRLAGAPDYHWWRQSAFIPKVESSLLYGAQLLPPRYYERFYRSFPERAKDEIKDELKV